MKRRFFLFGLVASAALGGPALAEDHAARIVRQLKRQGYANVQVARTWLGRVRIVAYRKGAMREIVLNPATGEILRDLWQAQSAASPVEGSAGGGGGTTSSDDRDDDSDDDSDDDHGDDDHGDDGGDDSGGYGGGDDGGGDDGGGDDD